MELSQLQSFLAHNPNDWSTRCSVAQILYDAEQYPEAAQVINEAPEIPLTEENVLFAATILGAEDVSSGHSLLDQFIAIEPTEGALELKARLYEMSGDKAGAAKVRNHAEHSAPPAAMVTAVSMVPKTLRPPQGEGIEEFPQAYERLEPVADEGAEFTWERDQEGEKALIVADGEAIHGQEAPKNTHEKMGAIMAAIMVHIAIVFLLFLAKVATPRPEPPSITASAVAGPSSESLVNEIMQKTSPKTAASVSTSSQVMSSDAFSDFAIPSTPELSNDFNTMSMADSMESFSMSMIGMGEPSNMGAIPASMRSRCSMSERMKRLRESGGEDRAERAVRKGLDFLTSQQDRETGAIGKKFKVGMTGLSLLAYLGHCETPESPKYGDSVVKAALYLMDRGLKNRGIITTENEKGGHEVYEHAIATYALAELYTMTKESGKEIPRLDSVLRKAVEIIVDAQDGLGGWSYGFTADNNRKEDMSVSGWQIQALKAAYNTGRNFPKVEKALDNAVKDYLPKIQDAKGAFKYNPDHPEGKASLTGAAALSMQMWNDMESPTYQKTMSYLANTFKNPHPGNNFYAPYYNTQAFFLHGGPEWEAYNKAFQPRLLDAQNEDGSWTKPGAGGHGGEDSQVMNTAWGILMLEVYYRYLPTTDKVRGLKKS